MQYIHTVSSPLGGITLASDGRALTGLWFDGQKYDRAGLPESTVRQALPVFEEACQWLTRYFQGQQPDVLPPLDPRGTDFQRAVWDLLLEIPRGQTVTYGQLAARLGNPRSAQAVGSAVGRNPISILIPCHRVLGADGALTGYAGGLDRKRALLTLEGVLTG